MVLNFDASFSISMAENQTQNDPPTPTTNPPQTIYFDNLQNKKKRKVGEPEDSNVDDSNANAENSGWMLEDNMKQYGLWSG
ncbi:uncharacterized protein LOC131630166 isoform X2 [Vicia villosa]|uniref:uncharacterized protein LOC131630166 isoform X2 n=1 Tax=Vicia villosa TaxID=3911 RepID=UPI00273C3827|nr:uncharacterized protein LOC131630166 isoform X2 [Vicia villosa]